MAAASAIPGRPGQVTANRPWGWRVGLRGRCPAASLKPIITAFPTGDPQPRRALPRLRAQPSGTQASEGHPDRVAALLEEHGVDTAQLQAEQPQAWAALRASLPLAQLAVRALAARKNTRASPSVAEWVARVAFLASEVGLPLAAVEARYVANPDNLQFRVATAREALAWLRDHDRFAPTRGLLLQRVSARYPQAWRTSTAQLEGQKQALQAFFKLSDAQWAAAVCGSPTLLNFHSATAQGVVGWLRELGLSEQAVARLFKLQPDVFKRSAAARAEKLGWLLGRLGIPADRGPTLIMRSTTLFNLSQGTIEGRIAALEQYGFETEGIAHLLLICGRLLNFDFEGKVRPTLAELERLLGAGRQEAVDLALRGGCLISVTPAKLRANFQWLLSHGLSEAQARAVLWETPQVFAGTLAGPAMTAKIRYYREALGIAPQNLLLDHRSYLKEGLAKVDRRVFCMEQRGELHRLPKQNLSWTAESDHGFSRRFTLEAGELEGCKQEWRRSERARRYGLA